MIVSSSDGYCSIIHFDENELGQIYKEPVNPLKETPKSKKSSNVVTKGNLSKNKTIVTIDVDESAVDMDIAKYNTVAKTNVSPEKPAETKPSKIAQSSGTEKSSSDPQAKKESNEITVEEETEDIKLVYEEPSTSEAPKTKAKTPPKANVMLIKSNKAPRRVQLITLSSPKGLKK